MSKISQAKQYLQQYNHTRNVTWLQVIFYIIGTHHA